MLIYKMKCYFPCQSLAAHQRCCNNAKFRDFRRYIRNIQSMHSIHSLHYMHYVLNTLYSHALNILLFKQLFLNR